MNRDTENLFYNQRLIIDNNVLTEPRTWQISKVNRIDSNGLCIVTCAQNKFDEHKDFIELDDKGNVIGMWASYYESAITPEEFEIENKPIKTYSITTFSGLKPEIKSGGSYKKFTVTFYDENDQVIKHKIGKWSITMDGKDVSDLFTIKTSDDSSDLDINQIKLKFIGGDMYIGKTVKVSYKSKDKIYSDVDIEIVSL